MCRQFGLILKGKREEKKTPIVKAPALFDSDEDEEEKVSLILSAVKLASDSLCLQLDVSGSSTSAQTIRLKKQAERMHEVAMAEDPTIFDYDASYEQDEKIRNQKVSMAEEVMPVRIKFTNDARGGSHLLEQSV